MLMKWKDGKTLAGHVLLTLICSAPNLGLSAPKTPDQGSRAPDWCYCARICQVTQGRANSAALVPPGQTLAICPQLHDEIVYDNMANCACPKRKRDQTPQVFPNWGTGEVTSPDH